MEVFSKFLSETDTTVRLAIPTTSLPHFQNLRGRDLLVRDWAEEEWTFRFSIRNIGHPRPVFSGDWVKFSQAKGLQPYDLLIFSRLEDDQYRVEVLRETDRLLTNDVLKFGEPPGEREKTSTLPTPNLPYESASPVYAALLTPQGRFLYDLFLYSLPRPDEKLNQSGSGPASNKGYGSVDVFADVDGSLLDELLQTFEK
ncbi:hypothetical protein Pint_28678 [Pistacia integerrima]|uniref:Uncharacterized protein n=1 Tax=Pistacia integerrima TaxID=434235 RepID=A0ACC0YQR3_9ROSI|nr:hypothetical protein Pint_28678 [Pistacia integerrima]